MAEMGDRSRFDDAAEIQKLSGLGLVACSSGKHKGETKISHRGRKRLRYWLFQAAKSAVAHSPEFKEVHLYYTTRAENPLKKMQSLIVIACKILRIMRDGTKYDHGKMLSTGAGQGSGKEPVNDGAFGSRISNKTNGNQGRHSVHRAIDTADGEAGRYDLKNKSCSQR